jgi:hypothetical protein
MQYKSIGFFFPPTALLLVQDVSCGAHIDLSHMVEVMLCTFLAYNGHLVCPLQAQNMGPKCIWVLSIFFEKNIDRPKGHTRKKNQVILSTFLLLMKFRQK